MIQKSAVKKYIKEKGFRSSPETLEVLQKVICSILDSVIEATKREKRKTIQAQDFYSVGIQPRDAGEKGE